MTEQFPGRTAASVVASSLVVVGLCLAPASCSGDAASPLGGTGGAAGGAGTAGGSGLAGSGGRGGGAEETGGSSGSGETGGAEETGDAGETGTGGAVGGADGGSGGAGGAPITTGLIWYADPDKGDAVFKNMDKEGGCTITVIDDPVHGKVRKFNRPPGTNRCEAHGAAGFSSKEGDLIYIGIRYKIVAPTDLTVTGIFQWKTYDTPGHPNTINYPVLIRPVSGRLVLEPHKPNAQVWSIPTPIDTWFTVVLAINESYDQKIGYIEFWYNGEQQSFEDGSKRYYCQTLDGGFIDPKWGIYGTNSSPKPQSASFITDLRIASDYASAAPESY
jgi:hypothetical protein